jgi:hypothetical protein
MRRLCARDLKSRRELVASVSFVVIMCIDTSLRWLDTDALAKLFVYSMAVDSPVRGDSASATPASQGGHTAYLAGSKAMDTLDRLITSTESFFHPSNSGPWTMLVSTSHASQLFTLAQS